MQRFYIHQELTDLFRTEDPGLHHQITRVLRMAPGERVIFFPGDGTESVYEIRSIDKRSITFERKNQYEKKIMPTYPEVTLYQALPNKIEKIEYILQKGTEIGISRFVFFRSDRSQKIALMDKKVERLKSIIQEATEQCGGVYVPELILVDDIRQYTLREECHILLDTIEEDIQRASIKKSQTLGLWVGPEGGWSKEERGEMNDKGFIFVQIGERILRTETAGIVVGFSLLHAEKIGKLFH